MHNYAFTSLTSDEVKSLVVEPLHCSLLNDAENLFEFNLNLRPKVKRRILYWTGRDSYNNRCISASLAHGYAFAQLAIQFRVTPVQPYWCYFLMVQSSYSELIFRDSSPSRPYPKVISLGGAVNILENLP
jgi:hypothetical protein